MHCCGNYNASHAGSVHNMSSSLCINSGRQAGRHADLRSAITLEHLEQHSCAQAKGEAYHQASSKDVQEPGKDSKHCSALQLYVFSQSLHTKSAWLCTEASLEVIQSNPTWVSRTLLNTRALCGQLVMHCIFLSAMNCAPNSK